MKAYNTKALLDFFRQQLQGQKREAVASYPDTGVDDTRQPLTAVTVDSLVAGIHFPLETPARWIAHKALAVNLSDLAAMGARPVSITLGLVLPAWDKRWLEEFCSGLSALYNAWDLQLIGGDVRAGPLSVTIQAHGHVHHKTGLRRSMAKPGEQIFVTGSLGDAACALSFYQQHQPLPQPYHDFLQQRFNYPDPRITAGLTIVDIASSAIDISDGLVSDLGHILEESACGAILHVDKLPASAALNALMNDTQRLQCQLGGGDDYELCFTLPASVMEQLHERFSTLDVTCTWIGEIVEGQGIDYLVNGQQVSLDIAGYDHFAGRPRGE